MDDAATFEQLIQFRAPSNLSKAIDRAASQRCQSKSDYIRQALVDRLQADGGSPLGEQQYCLVIDGELIATSFKPAKDDRGGVWLPIENEDNQPFDPALHWRLKPLPLRLDGDRVVRTYPVIAKCQEHA
ncbi:hypothetical protein LPJ38_03195 [Bradyrhizobium daqingense]|uniref:Uncharacterized protein n=1 Tax=Bradyrhizobium daqingense TaxID=993502 RepID=A0A562LJU4_9BRAD|nr:hypothetical protein [Bradyrhizobium daqingense]TWI07875.1 hypothetical protein IQ17_02232 [Bradyrhizobium daqingense]UFS89810.1 hypothetical protein LPJ38_03195 [Bradyrhizobium daqingense]